ncbi:HAD family hydrolase [Desulfovibrio ferrophilus]|uniref:Haloacid dehalogenase domain protein hydrolase n=1 Tax=Desulfovibrio ferrophilus TaxID=241368 RepID=A0A2Z6AYF3_9BACT|nr:HAD family phosphatase [Desulfovibrio ferrophilus]BBD08279.1 haloacid dehalogenase domain protein hydrolase [Desulfovibrio ferrophilus]
MEKKHNDPGARQVDAVIFDFGGVLAEEGFFDGFRALSEAQNIDFTLLSETAVDLAREGGYAEGRIDEQEFWVRLRTQTGLEGTDAELRHELLSRFILRPWMFEYVDKLRAAGYKVAVLSDQTNWLEELDAKHGMLQHFDLVWNSYRTGRTKKEPALFDDFTLALGVAPERALFVDDHGGHIRRAEARGMKAIHYVGREDFERRINEICPL